MKIIDDRETQKKPPKNKNKKSTEKNKGDGNYSETMRAK